MSNSDLDNSRMEIPVSETLPGPSGIKIEPKEDCEDLLSAFTVDPTPVKIENDDISDNSDEYDETLSEDYTVDVKKLKTEHTEDSKEWLNKPLIKSEENDQLAVSGEDQDDNFTEDSNIKSEEMHIKEDDGFNEPGISGNSRDRDVQEISTTKKTQTTVPQPFKCDQCDYQTPTKRNLTRHGRIHQNPENLPKFCCPDCDFTTIWKGCLKSHMKTCIRRNMLVQSVFQCCHCSYKTLSKNSLRDHLIGHHGMSPETLKMFGCYKCQFKTDWRHALREHLRLGCNLEDRDSQNAENKQKSALNVSESVDNDKFECQHCKYSTDKPSSFTIHLQQHEKGDFKTISKDKISGHKLHRCTNCEYATYMINDLECHLLAHRLIRKKIVMKQRLQQGSSKETDQTKSSEKGPPEDSC